jgi:hypothetical protein
LSTLAFAGRLHAELLLDRGELLAASWFFSSRNRFEILQR